MNKFVGNFIREGHRHAIVACVWLVVFAAEVGLIGWVGLHQVNQTMRGEAQAALDDFDRLRTNLNSTFAVLERDVTATPCSPRFTVQIRKVAYLPDGLNEFLYAPGGVVHCSASTTDFARPVRLGKADIGAGADGGFSVWLDRDLDFLGLDGLKGTIVAHGDYAAVVPKQNLKSAFHSAISLEEVIVSDSGRWWHRGGADGVYSSYLASTSSLLPVHDGAFHQMICDGDGLYCVAATAGFIDIVGNNWPRIVAVLLASLLFACWIAGRTNAVLLRFWSFEQRFRRHLDANSIELAYQPVMHLASGEIVGCEVLARWRDVDGSLIFPDRFIGIVERAGVTERFTRLVAARALAELKAAIPERRELQINFNIFPRDLQAGVLPDVFAGFGSTRGRFHVVLEIVESGAISAENVQQEIEKLRAAGIRTQIDDFGTGYSNLANLAALSVDGVKLDRSFAMAPDGSLTSEMLSHAVDMVHAAGRALVIEGIETAERLAQLRQIATGSDYVQGYFISRPLTAERFAAFLRTHRAQCAATAPKPKQAAGSRTAMRRYA
jgi:sensor c-di-GMP phosphodiesterase-like protein